MIAHVLDDKYEVVEKVPAEPVCGEDFCDYCGDCLGCDGGGECWDGRLHIWAVYSWKAGQFKARVEK